MQTKTTKILTIDVETDGLNPWKDKLVLIGWRVNGQGPVYTIYFTDTIISNGDIEEFRRLLADQSVLKRGHNIKFDSLFLAANGFDIVGPFEDTRIMAYAENPFQDVGLKSLTVNRLKRKVITFKELINDKLLSN